MRIEFSPEAKAEFDDAERYYEHQATGLGKRLRDEVRHALQRLHNWPLAARWSAATSGDCSSVDFPTSCFTRWKRIAFTSSQWPPTPRAEYWVERRNP